MSANPGTQTSCTHIRSDDGVAHVEGFAPLLGEAKGESERSFGTGCLDGCHLWSITGHGVGLVLERIGHCCTIWERPEVPRVARQPQLGKAQNVCTLCLGFLDQLLGLLDAARQVQPDRLDLCSSQTFVLLCHVCSIVTSADL